MGQCGKPGEQPDLTECSSSNDCYSRNCSNGMCGGGGASASTKACGSSPCNTIINGTTYQNSGTCVSQKWVYNESVTNGSLYTISGKSGCSDMCKKCANKYNWLYCSDKMPNMPPSISDPNTLDTGGICLANSGQQCKGDSDCLYQCVNGNCTDWPTKDCTGWLPTDAQCNK